MNDLPQIDNYADLFITNTPLLDVRAPIEYNKGAFPHSQNHPLMNDNEREDIGLCYKQKGQEQAIARGHQLIQGALKAERVAHWKNFVKQFPNGVLYCFRGGMRSKISQQWIYEATGIKYPRIKGGYKAMRRFLIDQLALSVENIQPLLLGGQTGIGKTLLLQTMDQKIDLEGLFHHRGSVFGSHITPQPSQIDIENSLSIELLKLSKKYQTLLFEDEGTRIGSRMIPDILYQKMKESPLIMLEATIEERIDITYQEYINESLGQYQRAYGKEKGFAAWADQLHLAFDKIQRRLGGDRYKALKAILSDAILLQKTSDDAEHHKMWIKKLLIDYYDPMYDFQNNKKAKQIAFKGNKNEVLSYLQETYQIHV